MTHIYVTYRKLDINTAERDLVLTQLRRTFGNDKIIVTPASDDAELITLRREVADADVLLVLMGEHYLSMVDDEGRRIIDNPLDYHHAEVVAAVEAKLWLGVILLENELPVAEQLPSPLRPLITDSTVFDLRDKQQVAQVIDDLRRQLIKDKVRRKPRMNFPGARRSIKVIKSNPKRWQRVSRGLQAVILFLLASVLMTWLSSAPPDDISRNVNPTTAAILTQSGNNYATVQANVEARMTRSPMNLSQAQIAETAAASINRYVVIAGGADKVITASSTLREISEIATNLRLIAITPVLRGTHFAFSSDEGWLASVDGQAVNIYDIRRLNRISVEDLTFRSPVLDVTFSDDGDYLIVLTDGNDQNDIWLYTHETYSIDFLERITVSDETTLIEEENKRLFTNTGNTYLLPSLQNLTASDLPAGVVASEQVVYAHDDNKIIRVRVGDDGQLYRNGLIVTERPPSAQLAYSTSANRLVVSSGAELDYYDPEFSDIIEEQSIRGDVMDIAAHPTKPMLALHYDNIVALHGILNNTTYTTVMLTDPIAHMRFAPNGRVLAVATASGNILLYGVAFD